MYVFCCKKTPRTLSIKSVSDSVRHRSTRKVCANHHEVACFETGIPAASPSMGYFFFTALDYNIPIDPPCRLFLCKLSQYPLETVVETPFIKYKQSIEKAQNFSLFRLRRCLFDLANRMLSTGLFLYLSVIYSHDMVTGLSHSESIVICHSFVLIGLQNTYIRFQVFLITIN